MTGGTEEINHVPSSMQFLFGGMAGMGATCFTHPFHLVKNRMQVRKEKANDKRGSNGPRGTVGIVRDVLQKEGIRGIYSGISAGLLRQATYATARLGIYSKLTEEITRRTEEQPNFVEKAGMGMMAGICAAFISTPVDGILIRMTLDGKRPIPDKWNYKNTFHAFADIYEKEGLLKLWHGAVPAMTRSMVLNSVQLASYAQMKEIATRNGFKDDHVWCQFTCSIISGLVTVLASLPVDNAKTRMHNMKTTRDGKPEYNGMWDLFKKIVKNEGLLTLWRGFTPYWCKLGPHTVLTFVFLEQLENCYKDFFGITAAAAAITEDLTSTAY